MLVFFCILSRSSLLKIVQINSIEIVLMTKVNTHQRHKISMIISKRLQVVDATMCELEPKMRMSTQGSHCVPYRKDNQIFQARIQALARVFWDIHNLIGYYLVLFLDWVSTA